MKDGKGLGKGGVRGIERAKTSKLLFTAKVDWSVVDLGGRGCSVGREEAVDKFSGLWSLDLGRGRSVHGHV